MNVEITYDILEHIFDKGGWQMKFIHISDVHLGIVPDAGKEWSKKRAQDIWDSFAEVVLEAGRQQADFLFISGDLFHKQPLKRELREVNYLFEQIPDVKIVLVAGNHDYLQPKSYYIDFEWAKNVFFFSKEDVTSFDFPEDNVTIYGASYWHREIRERLYDNLVVADSSRINILLAHGGDERHIPFSAEQILNRGIDYIAAGHIHKGGWLMEGKALMAGALEPTDCNDTGVHGYWKGEITKTGRRLFDGIRATKEKAIVGDDTVQTQVEFYPIHKCEYNHLMIKVTPKTTQYELETQVKEHLREGEEYILYRVFLEGYIEPDMVFDLGRLVQMGQIVDVSVNLFPNYDYGRMVQEQPDSLLARYVVQMNRLPQNEISKKALEYGVNALLGHKICR